MAESKSSGSVGELDAAGTTLTIRAPRKVSDGEAWLRVVCISDTHNAHRKIPVVPDGDVLLHAGDMTHTGSVEEFEAFNKWLGELPHEHKFLVAGNHDYSMLSKLVRSPAREPKRGPIAPQWAPGQQVVATKGSKTGKRGTLVAWDEDEKKWVVDWGEAEGGQRGYRSKNLRSAAGQEDLTPENPDDLLRRCLLSNAKILDGQTATLRGVRLFGSGWNHAKPETSRKIPAETDIVVTHLPPPKRGGGQWLTQSDNASRPAEKAAKQLLQDIQVAKPLMHLSGHVHEIGGTAYTVDGTLFVNAAMVVGADSNDAVEYDIGNPAIVVEM